VFPFDTQLDTGQPGVVIAISRDRAQAVLGSKALLISAYLYLRRRDGYRENPFEIEAYAVDTPNLP
jgi:hypothetical protein